MGQTSQAANCYSWLNEKEKYNITRIILGLYFSMWGILRSYFAKLGMSMMENEQNP